MGVEIERKFLVRGDAWKTGGGGVDCRQGYLSSAVERVVRVRTMGSRARLTIKGESVGAVRQEFEYDIPVEDALSLLELCDKPLIEKTRYVIGHGGLVWEVDEFHGVNAGLIIAECELESEDQPVVLPDWIGEEVTGDFRYYNSNLVAKPYSCW